MGVEASVSGCSSQLLIVLVANVTSSSGVFVPFGQAKVNYVDDVLLLAHADQEIVRLDVSV